MQQPDDVRSAANGRWIVIDLGLREVMFDWERGSSSVTDEATGEKVGFIDLNDGRKLRVWIEAEPNV